MCQPGVDGEFVWRRRGQLVSLANAHTHEDAPRSPSCHARCPDSCRPHSCWPQSCLGRPCPRHGCRSRCSRGALPRPRCRTHRGSFHPSHFPPLRRPHLRRCCCCSRGPRPDPRCRPGSDSASAASRDRATRADAPRLVLRSMAAWLASSAGRARWRHRSARVGVASPRTRSRAGPRGRPRCAGRRVRAGATLAWAVSRTLGQEGGRSRTRDRGTNEEVRLAGHGAAHDTAVLLAATSTTTATADRETEAHADRVALLVVVGLHRCELRGRDARVGPARAAARRAVRAALVVLLHLVVQPALKHRRRGALALQRARDHDWARGDARLRLRLGVARRAAARLAPHQRVERRQRGGRERW